MKENVFYIIDTIDIDDFIKEIDGSIHYPYKTRFIKPEAIKSNAISYTKGEVYSFTTMQSGPTGFNENAPYTVALIQLEEGPMLTAQLTDLDPAEEVTIGLPVEMVTRKLRTDAGAEGIILYSYKFRPVFTT